MINTKMIKMFTKFTADEYPLFAQVLKNPAVMQNITGKPICENEIKKAWERVLNVNGKNNDFGFYKIIKNGQYVGYGKLSLETDVLDSSCSEMGYFLLPEFWGQGIGYQVGLELIALAKNFPYPIMATVSQDNAISKKLLSKLGLVFYQHIELDDKVGEVWVLKD